MAPGKHFLVSMEQLKVLMSRIATIDAFNFFINALERLRVPFDIYSLYYLTTQHTQKPAPYGTCNPDSNDTMTECTERCLDETRADTCGCMAPYMDFYKQSTIIYKYL